MSGIIHSIRGELKRSADRKTRESGERFFKEPVKMYGVKTDVVRGIGKRYFKVVQGRGKAAVFELCGGLWRSGYLEESFIACNWSFRLHKQYEPADFKVFERWIHSYVNNWASCDTLCNHTVGEFIEMYPDFLSALKRFARSDNRWVKRAAAVSLILVSS